MIYRSVWLNVITWPRRMQEQPQQFGLNCVGCTMMIQGNRLLYQNRSRRHPLSAAFSIFRTFLPVTLSHEIFWPIFLPMLEKTTAGIGFIADVCGGLWFTGSTFHIFWWRRRCTMAVQIPGRSDWGLCRFPRTRRSACALCRSAKYGIFYADLPGAPYYNRIRLFARLLNGQSLNLVCYTIWNFWVHSLFCGLCALISREVRAKIICEFNMVWHDTRSALIANWYDTE